MTVALSAVRAWLFSGFGRAGPDFFGPRAGRAFDENNFGRAFGLSGLLHKPYFYQTLNGPDFFIEHQTD